jgi:hypothetical protein
VRRESGKASDSGSEDPRFESYRPGHLVNIGIRIPDPYRMQVGCRDYDIAGREDFVASLPKTEQGFMRPFPDMKDKFIELWHPDYDVAGYIPLG